MYIQLFSDFYMYFYNRLKEGSKHLNVHVKKQEQTNRDEKFIGYQLYTVNILFTILLFIFLVFHRSRPFILSL